MQDRGVLRLCNSDLENISRCLRRVPKITVNRVAENHRVILLSHPSQIGRSLLDVGSQPLYLTIHHEFSRRLTEA